MRIDRMLAMTVMMLNRDRITARELADKFDVSVRTIYRDLEAIDQAGIPIVSHSGNRGGYGIMDTFRIDRQYLTFDDIVSMVSTLRGVNSALENRELDLAIEKIVNLVPQNKTDDLKKYEQQVVVDIMPLGYSLRQKERFSKVHGAVCGQKLLRFDYCNTKGEHTNRTVEPMTLIFKGYAWYLFAYCRLKEDYRLFRLSRMNQPVILDETFETRDKTFRDVFSGNSSSVRTIHLKLLFSAFVRMQVEDFFEPKQIMILKEGNMQVEVDFPEDEWVYSFLLGYGEHVTVLEPFHIRHILAEKAKKIFSLYQT
ncbi:YafY family transcriptional regulator [bacterium]|nr:YafY family transcriptional regulator [bacterium]